MFMESPTSVRNLQKVKGNERPKHDPISFPKLKLLCLYLCHRVIIVLTTTDFAHEAATVASSTFVQLRNAQHSVFSFHLVASLHPSRSTS